MLKKILTKTNSRPFTTVKASERRPGTVRCTHAIVVDVVVVVVVAHTKFLTKTYGTTENLDLQLL